MPPLCRCASAAAAKPLRRSSAALEAGPAKGRRPLRKNGSTRRPGSSPQGGPGKGPPPAPKKRLDRQPGMQLAEMLDDLPKHGDWGVRFDERGRKQRWKGYKLHCDLSDSGL